MLKGKHVLLGVTGGIASYKIATLASLLVKAQADVHVIMTENAANFINPITFETLTGHKCITDTFDRNFEFKVEHIALAQLADVVMVAPATANVMAKLAHGLADDMLTTTVLASRAPKIIAPAMNTAMYENPVTQDNIELLKHYGMEVITPSTGHLACGDNGAGADVTLVTGRTSLDAPLFVNTIPIVSAKDMYREVTSRSQDMDIIIKAAAVADYRPCNVSDEKIKKKDDDTMSIPLERTDDILKYLGEHKKAGQFLCGFSMETQNMLTNSKKKLEKKNLDMIVANNLKEQGAGFETDTNIVTMITPDQIFELELMSKEEVAFHLLDKILELKNEM